jgi:LPPG:FO 2-phospho-L-lactate transferase
LKELGFDEGLMIGDLDRATHIIRSELLRKAYSLTEAIEELKNRFEIAERILPMCEEEIESIVVTSQGEMHFQDFWVKHRGEPDVVDVKFAGIENARMTEEVEIVLDECDAVVIGPSNPITSIMPIISVNGFNKKLKNKKVLAVSPIIGKKAFSGPAGKLMRAKGFEVSPTGVADCYREFLDVLIVDEVDSHLAGTHGKYEIVSTKTIIKDKKEALELAKFIGEVI